MHPTEFSKCRNAELTGDSPKGALPVILKILGTLSGKFVKEAIFSIITAGFTTDFHVIFYVI